MISSDLKAADLNPRASLPFSWNSDGDSGIATGGPNGATAFQAHLKSAQSAHSSETGSSPVADAPQKAEMAGSADPSSRVSFQNPSSDPQVRPSIKPIRKASLNLRAMVDAKVRFIGPSTAPISTPSGNSLVPSAQSGSSSWGEPLGYPERLESDSRRPPALNSGSSPRNEILQGLPERPLMDFRRLPDAEVVVALNKRGDSQEVPSSKQISADVFSAPSDAGLTYASRRLIKRPNSASSPESNFEMQPDLASGREELPASISTKSGVGKSTSSPQTSAAMGARVGALQIPANGSKQWVGTAETAQSLPTSQSATVFEPVMGSDPIASGVRETARRAVEQSQILGTPPVSGATVRPANNNDAFRSLILDPGEGTFPSLTTDSAPPFGDPLSDNDLRPNSGTPSASSLSSFLPSSSTPSRTSEPNGAELSANTQPETVQKGVPNPTRVQRNIGTTAPTPLISKEVTGTAQGISELETGLSVTQGLTSTSGKPPVVLPATGSNLQSTIPVESGSQNGAFVQREARSVNPSSELIEQAPANTQPETFQKGVPNPTRVQRNIGTTAPTALISKEVTGTAQGISELETGLSITQGLTSTSGNPPVVLAATGSNLQSTIPVESGSQNGAFVQREARSGNPSSELIEEAPTVEAVGLNASSESSFAESQSQPKPSEQPLRPANRSPRSKGTDTVVSNTSARTSLEADKSFPTPLVLENDAEDRMRFDSLSRDAGSGSSSDPGRGHSPSSGTPVTGLFPGTLQAPLFQEPLVDGASNLPKTADAGTSSALLHESDKSSAVRLVHLDSPGAGGLELRIQEVGDKLIVRTQDLVGSIDEQSAQWKELQQRLETSGIVLMPVEASLGATTAPVEPRSPSEELRHTICYDGNMDSTGRDSSDPRSSSGRARSSGESSHRASPELPDETTDSAEAPPASRQWWA